MDVITMSSVVQHGLIQQDRIFTVSVLLPDKAGELVKVAQTIAGAGRQRHKAGAQPIRQQQQECVGRAEDNNGIIRTEHKNKILDALEKDGYKPKVVDTKLY